jgi:hypothetical protein
MYIAVMWAVSIHMVTAFLLAGLPARPFWNTALLGPRFLASAFTAGPAFMILLLWFIRRRPLRDQDGAFTKLALITTVAAQINLVMLGSELFYKFYFAHAPRHQRQVPVLRAGRHNALVPWIWTAIALNVWPRSSSPSTRSAATRAGSCRRALVLFVAIWVEKGMGLVIPGFVPSPLGEIVEYTPTWVELAVTAGSGRWGLFVLTVLVRVALPIELGHARSPGARRGRIPTAAPWCPQRAAAHRPLIPAHDRPPNAWYSASKDSTSRREVGGGRDRERVPASIENRKGRGAAATGEERGARNARASNSGGRRPARRISSPLPLRTNVGGGGSGARPGGRGARARPAAHRSRRWRRWP